jgi:hypothetical protein
MDPRSLTALLAVAAATALTGCATAPEPTLQPGAAAAGMQAPQPITGAFGLTLGQRYTPDYVAKVLSEHEYLYLDQKGTQRKGKVFRVEPKAPHDAFTEYRVATTAEGLIYSITGSHADPGRNDRCEPPRRVAAELGRMHGAHSTRPGADEWNFRDASVTAFRGVDLHASHCRIGRYSIIYSDEAVMSPPP